MALTCRLLGCPEPSGEAGYCSARHRLIDGPQHRHEVDKAEELTTELAELRAEVVALKRRITRRIVGDEEIR